MKLEKGKYYKSDLDHIFLINKEVEVFGFSLFYGHLMIYNEKTKYLKRFGNDIFCFHKNGLGTNNSNTLLFEFYPKGQKIKFGR